RPTLPPVEPESVDQEEVQPRVARAHPGAGPVGRGRGEPLEPRGAGRVPHATGRTVTAATRAGSPTAAGRAARADRSDRACPGRGRASKQTWGLREVAVTRLRRSDDLEVTLHDL